MVDAVVNQHIQYHLDWVTDKKVFIVSLLDLCPKYSHFKSNKDIIVDLSYINSCPAEYDCILIDYATNYLREDIEEVIYNQLCQHSITKPWIIITSNFKYFYQKHSRIVYYPIYLIDGIDKGGNTLIDIKKPRGYLTCFLTYHYHWHRLVMLAGLYTKIGFDSCLLNLYEIDKMADSQRQSLIHSQQGLTIDELAIINDIFKLAPIEADPTDSQIEIVNLENRAFFDSYINVFTESDYPSPIITEKSVKPFLSGQLFAVIGSSAGYQHLKDLGFDLFEDYISIPKIDDNFQKVINEMLTSITRISNNIEQVWTDTYERRLYNYNLSRSNQLRTRLTADLHTKLNSI